MNYIGHLLAIGLLTLVTQVGGAFYLLAVIVYKVLKLKKWQKLVTVIAIYLFGILVVIPPLAKQNNRVAMPVFKSKKVHVGSHTLFTVLANRHYVRPEMKQMLVEVATEMHSKYPGIKIEYLDGSFPLFKEYRMLPHLKHDDGRKLDVNYIRTKQKSGKYSNRYFSFFGYGFSEKPKVNESNFPAECAKRGKWQYNIIEQAVPDQKWRNLEFPVNENRDLLKSIVDHSSTKYVFIEPHLKQRLGLSDNSRVKFHGCWAVRHDDHMHIQLQR